MADVARRAGVALGTVSNTLNSPEKVRPEVRDRVHAAIEELGWVRNAAARSLATGTSTTIGIVLVDLGNTLFVDMARGAEEAARERGMNVLIADAAIDVEKQREAITLFEETHVAGIVLAPLDPEAAGAPATTLHSRKRPLVLVNQLSLDGRSSAVVADEHLGGYLAATHLLGLGRRDLVFVGGPEQLHVVAERHRGAAAAVAETAGARLTHITVGGQNIPHGREAAGILLARGQEVDGVVAASDLLAVGLMQVLLRDGRRIPEDVAVTGYDNNHFASETALPVSTVAQPGHAMGRRAAELLLDQLQGEQERRTEVLAPSLIPRQSTLGEAWRTDGPQAESSLERAG
jgi:LacI family transcriptional regulator